MASPALRAGFKFAIASTHTRSLLSAPGRVHIIALQAAAPISTKTSRAGIPNPHPKWEPWPYEEKGYSLWNCLMTEGTLKRIDENSKVIVVEGLPCVGKTDVAKKLADEFQMRHFPMATLEQNYYTNLYGHNLREIMDPKLPPHLRSYVVNDFVKNPHDVRAAQMTLQMFYIKFLQYMNALAHLLNTGEGVVLERSPYSHMVFVEAMAAAGYLTRNERKEYHIWSRMCLEAFLKPHLIVFLDVSPETAEQNLRQRGKGEEKVYNKEFLQKMDDVYKKDFLPAIEEHAEVLVYDWNVPGDPEVVAEDIERIDFDRFDILDPKMEDWRMRYDSDWCQRRFEFTNTQQRGILINGLLNHDMYGTRFYWSAEDNKTMEDVYFETPGGIYSEGFNPHLGDSVLLKSKGPVFKL